MPIKFIYTNCVVCKYSVLNIHKGPRNVYGFFAPQQ